MSDDLTAEQIMEPIITTINRGRAAIEELDQIRSTLIVNFGPLSKQPFIVGPRVNYSTFKMMFTVLESLTAPPPPELAHERDAALKRAEESDKNRYKNRCELIDDADRFLSACDRAGRVAGECPASFVDRLNRDLAAARAEVERLP